MAFTLMSNKRIAAEEFISHLQLTQNSINFYRNHSAVVSIAAVEGDSSALEPSEGEAEATPQNNAETAEFKIPPPQAPSL